MTVKTNCEADGALHSTSDYSDYNMQMETTPRGPNPCWGWGGAAAATRDYRVSGY